MKKLLLNSLVVTSLMLGGCASWFKPDVEEKTIVKIETVYETVPASIVDCPPPVVLSDEQLLEIIAADTDDSVDSEDLYNKYYVGPTASAHEICWKSSIEILKWNKENE